MKTTMMTMPKSSTPNPNDETDALADLIQRETARDPGFADEVAAFRAALDLTARRKASGLSQADVAERMGLDQSGVARIERDPSVVSLDKFRRYAAALGFTVELVPVKKPSRRRA